LFKSYQRFLPTAVCSAFLCLSSQSQTYSSRYTEYEHGEYLFYYQKWDSAFLLFNRYLNNAADSLKKGKAYKSIGEIQWRIGDMYGAQASLTSAIQTLDPVNKAHREVLAIVYNLLGNISLDLKMFEEAIDFYNKAMNFAKESGYSEEVLNGKSTTLQKKGSYTEAICIYDSILALNRTDPFFSARIIHNMARTKWLQNNGHNVLPEFYAALKIRLDNQDNQGLTASYAHLSDYYAAGNADSASWYANKMREQAVANQQPDDVLEAIDKLIRSSNSATEKENWYAAFKKLNDSLQFSRDTTRNRFAFIRYDVQKSKADNLVLQQHITLQQFWMYGLVALSLLIFAVLGVWYSKRKKRIQLESENAVRNANLKTSQKVHDVVANGLYGIMNELEYLPALDREILIEKIEDLYEKSRNISYENIATENNAAYDEQVHRILTSYANEQTKVIVVGNQPLFWNSITGPQKQQLQLVLSELMVNMKKHSGAKNVVIVFKKEDSEALVTYKDDGTGFTSGKEFGNGLNNTVSRIKTLNGGINFGESEKGGVSITIHFPL